MSYTCFLIRMHVRYSTLGTMWSAYHNSHAHAINAHRYFLFRTRVLYTSHASVFYFARPCEYFIRILSISHARTYISYTYFLLRTRVRIIQIMFSRSHARAIYFARACEYFICVLSKSHAHAIFIHVKILIARIINIKRMRVLFMWYRTLKRTRS